jgi:DNA-binding beta-propeller fold protein YncE
MMMGFSSGKSLYLTTSVLLLLLNHLGFSATVPPAHSFVLTDSTPAATLFDPAHNVVYATVPDLNELVVISISQHVITSRIAIPGAYSMDLSPDGTQLLVGSGSSTLGGSEIPVLTLIDTRTLQITGRYTVPVLTDIFGGTIPSSMAWTSNGTVLIVAQEAGTTGFHLIRRPFKGAIERLLDNRRQPHSLRRECR